VADQNLGKAVLYLDVDDTALVAGLKEARQKIKGVTAKGTPSSNRAELAKKRLEDRRAATMAITRRLGDQVRKLEEQGLNTAEALSAVKRASAATDKGRLETARAHNRTAKDLLKTLEKTDKAQKSVVLSARGLGRAPLAGSVREVGSPRFVTRAVAQGGQREDLNAIIAAQEKRFDLAKKITRLEEQGVDVSKLREQLGRATTAQAKRQFGSFKQVTRQLTLSVRKAQEKLRITQREQNEILKNAARSPIRGDRNTPGSPKYIEDQNRLMDQAMKEGNRNYQRRLKERERRTKQAERESARLRRERRAEARRATQRLEQRRARRRDIASSALIGGGFPLLFGQGVGAAGGGALGGLLGGLAGGQAGFALSIAGTALGTQVDASIRKVETLSKAFDSPIKSFQTLSQEGLISSRSLEKQIEALISTGRAAEASALIQKDLATAFGGLQAANIADTFDRLNRNFAQLSVTVGGFIAGPLNKFLEILNRALAPAPGGDQPRERDRFKAEKDTLKNIVVAGVGLATGGAGAAPARALIETRGGLAGAVFDRTPTDEQIAESKQKAIRAQEKQNEANQRFQRIQKLNKALAISNIQNNRELSLRLQKRIALLQKLQDTQALSGSATEIEKAAIKDRFDLEAAQIKAKQDLLVENENRERRQAASAIAGIKARGEAAEKVAVAEANGQKTLAITIQNRVKQEEKIRDLKEAQNQLNAELAKPPPERDTNRIDALVQSVEAANANVLTAYQEGGAALVRNATTAAERLKGAQQSISSVLRGGFEFLSPQFREQELARARASIASGERRGLLRGGVDISTPERLFAVANFVESFNQAEDELQQAIRENTAAQQALAAKEPVNVFVSGQAAVSTSTVGAINRGS